MKDAAEADLLMIKTTREVALQTAIQTGDLNTARYLKGDTFTKQDAEANYTAMKLRERTDKLNEQSLTESLINEIMGKDKSLNRQEAYQKIQDLSSGQKNAIKNILPSITGEEFQLALDENLQNLAQNKAPITRDQMQKIVNNVIRRYKV
ncbi:MAG: hypothetical protein P4L69_00120, partial [Desulfosporosinus sp.]|nr:hypothetical protein [Desulfosporosinus sp.]